MICSAFRPKLEINKRFGHHAHDAIFFLAIKVCEGSNVISILDFSLPALFLGMLDGLWLTV